MRYRMLSSNGDFTFGQSALNFFVNDVQAVAQAVKTRLGLWQGEWFLNTSSGTPYLQRILGKGTRGTADISIRQIILGTPGVVEIATYNSVLDTVARTFTVTATINTVYGTTQINESLTVSS